MLQCPDCRREVGANWRNCSGCGCSLARETCPQCTQLLEAGWRFCAFCGEPVYQPGEAVARGWRGPTPTCRLLHLTDLHMTASPEAKLMETNWTATYPIRARLEGILAQESPRVDHILLTGDLTDSGLDDEYDAVVRILAAHGCKNRATVIPGNHELVQGGLFQAADKEVQLTRFLSWLGPYVPPAATRDAMFPVVRWLHDRIVFIGLDTTGEGRSLYKSSSGSVEPAQLERLQAILDCIPDAVRKVIGLHHSLYPPKTRKSFFDAIRERFFMYLENADALRHLLLGYRNIIVIHGHHHFDLLHEEQPGEGRLINLGAASSTMPDEEEKTLQYVVLELYEDAVMSIMQTYEDAPGGIKLVGEPARRRFSLQMAAVPKRIERILATPRFRRDAADRLTLQQWRQVGRIDSGTRTTLAVPGFLRSASDILALRRKGLLGQHDTNVSKR